MDVTTDEISEMEYDLMKGTLTEGSELVYYRSQIIDFKAIFMTFRLVKLRIESIFTGYSL